MIRDLDQKRKKELALFSNMIVTINYLPEIMKKLKETNQDKNLDSITDEIISTSIISLSPWNQKRIKSILRSASIKGKEYKEFKALITKRFEKENKANRKSYHFTNPVELFFATNTELIKIIYTKRVDGQEKINEEERDTILTEQRKVIDDYIDNIFSERDRQIARRKS